MPRIDRRDHDVVDAIDHQGRLLDFAEVRKAVLTLCRLDIGCKCSALSHCDLNRAWGVLIGTLVAPFPERQARFPGSFRATEEEEQEVLDGGDGVRSGFSHTLCHARITTAQTGAEQHQLAHQRRVTQCHFLNLQATDGETEQVDLGQPQGLDGCCNVIRHLLNGGGRSARR
ncbi:hypothetical protein D3C81_1235990 [compost metagenome]